MRIGKLLSFIFFLILINSCKKNEYRAEYICHQKYEEDFSESVLMVSDIEEKEYQLLGKTIKRKYSFLNDNLKVRYENGSESILSFNFILRLADKQYFVYSEDEDIIDGITYTIFDKKFGPVLIYSPYWPGSFCILSPKKEIFYDYKLLRLKLDSTLSSSVPNAPSL